MIDTSGQLYLTAVATVTYLQTAYVCACVRAGVSVCACRCMHVHAQAKVCTLGCVL